MNKKLRVQVLDRRMSAEKPYLCGMSTASYFMLKRSLRCPSSNMLVVSSAGLGHSAKASQPGQGKVLNDRQDDFSKGLGGL